MANPWFRMYTDFLDDPKMVSLAFEDQRHFIGILALKSMDVLDADCDPVLLNRIVSQKLWIDFALIGEVKNRLVKAGLIDKDWQPVAWGKRQFVSDQDISGAERQRKYREKHRNALRNVTGDGDSNALCNTSVTLPDTDTEQNITNTSPAKLPTCPLDEFIKAYHDALPDLPAVRLMNASRKKAVNDFWKWVFSTKKSDGTPRATTREEALAWITSYFLRANDNDFLMGKSNGNGKHSDWRADFDFLLTEKGKTYVIEKTRAAS